MITEHPRCVAELVLDAGESPKDTQTSHAHILGLGKEGERKRWRNRMVFLVYLTLGGVGEGGQIIF